LRQLFFDDYGTEEERSERMMAGLETMRPDGLREE
jgi:hypothetical protein